MRRHPSLWLFVLFVLTLCAPVPGCSSRTALARPGTEWVELSSKRLVRAIESLERAKVNPRLRRALLARIEAAQRLRDDLAASLKGPAGERQGPDAERIRAALAAAERRLEELAEESEEHALRGSVHAAALLSELAWEAEHLKELARRAAGSADVVPENLLMLLSKPTLKELHERWTDGLKDLQKAAASAPPGTFKRRIDETQAKLSSIQQALDAPGVDLVQRFFHADKRPEIDPPLLQWLAERASQREQEIHERTVSRLTIENAKDGTDVGVLMELRRLVGSGPEDALAGRRALAMKRARGFHLPSASQAVRDLLQNRFADPLEAVRAEAALKLQWQELSVLDPSRRPALLPSELARSFTDWMVSHLSDEDLEEVKAYLDEARGALRATDLQVPMFMQGRLDVDRRVIEAEAAAVARELDHRRTAGRPRAPPPPSDLSDAEKALLARHATPVLPARGSSAPDREALWEALRSYEARTNPTAEARRLRLDLEILGYHDEVTRLVDDGRVISQLADTAARGSAESIQAQRAQRLRLGLSALHVSHPGEVQRLLEQVDKVVPPTSPASPAAAAGVPPDGVRPYGDFVLLRCSNEMKSVRGPVAAPDRSSDGASSDFVQFATLLAETRRKGLEHPLVMAANEADIPSYDDDSTRGNRRPGDDSKRNGDAERTRSADDGAHRKKTTSPGPGRSRPSGPRPRTRR